MRLLFYWLLIAALVLIPPAFSLNNTTDYARAEQFVPANVIPTLYNVSITPNWIDGSSSFWYLRISREGKQFILVDIKNRTKEFAFNQTALAKVLAAISGDRVDPSNLPFSYITFMKGNIRFSAFNKTWQCNLQSYSISEVSTDRDARPGEGLSPDGSMAAYVHDYNLWIRDISAGEKYPLTTDGSKDYAYATRSDTVLHPISQVRLNDTPMPYAVWSPDSRRIATFRMNQSNVTPLYLLQYVPDNSSRPRPWTYRFAMPGDKYVPMYEPVVIDVLEKKIIPIAYKAQPEVSLMDTDE